MIARIAAIAGAALAVGAILAWLAPGRAPASHAYFDAAPEGRAEIIAHGGGQGARPPNTIVALEAALAMGADVLEVDAQLTRDGILILRHDATLDRTTDMSGRIADMDYSEIARADAGANDVAGRDFSGEGIRAPKLSDALAAFPDARWIIEIKPDTEEAARAMCRDIRAAGAATRALVASFHDAAMAAFRRACPEVATSMSSREATRFVLAAYVGLAKFLPLEAVALQIPEESGGLRLVTPRTIGAARRRGVRMQIWTINDPEDMRRLLSLGVDGVMTDRVDLLKDAVDAAKASG